MQTDKEALRVKTFVDDSTGGNVVVHMIPRNGSASLSCSAGRDARYSGSLRFAVVESIFRDVLHASD